MYPAIRLLIAGVGVLLSWVCIAAQATPSEAPLRVAFVYNFIKFIEWPDMDSAQSIRLCASTSDDSTKAALAKLQGKTANKRLIEIIYLEPHKLDTVARCQMLYITQMDQDKSLPNPLPSGVVLVADEASVQDANVSIALLRNPDGRIEFAVNNNAVIQAGVRISSQLLKLAKNSRGGTSTND